MVRKTLNNLRCLFREILSLYRKEGQQLILLQVPLTVFWICYLSESKCNLDRAN